MIFDSAPFILSFHYLAERIHFYFDWYIFVSSFRGGKICLTDHFKPLWAKNVPKFGIAHAFALGVRQAIYISLNISILKKQVELICHSFTVYTLAHARGNGVPTKGVQYTKYMVIVHFNFQPIHSISLEKYKFMLNIINSSRLLFQLGPWLAVEIPDLVSKGIIQHKDEQNGAAAAATS